ncbi:hypothetical protein BP5796_06530 [Coleophoma crateriformis]|uniref:Leucine-rich repeat domain-containing protein n=1 Tax=Coleophoma crateriformis TaxID=565419 RepID=A0A3D8RNT2_9HELO|nr:hypothetical protein BP5796_06530 [Coleophoma crateriformis]
MDNAAQVLPSSPPTPGQAVFLCFQSFASLTSTTPRFTATYRESCRRKGCMAMESISTKGLLPHSDNFSPLDALSDEVLLEIIHWLDMTDPPSSLPALKYTCSRLFNIIKSFPHLYYAENVNSAGETNLIAFLNHALSRPDIGPQYRSVTFCSDGNPLTVNTLKPDFSERCNAFIFEICAETGWNAELWMSRITSGNWEDIVALVMCAVPNVQALSLPQHHWNMEEEPHFLDLVFQHAAKCQAEGSHSKFSLSKLASLDMAHWDTENGINLGSVKDFLLLPSMKRADFWAFSEDLVDEGANFHVRQLTLANSGVTGQAFVNLMKRCPFLERLDYEHGGPLVSDGDFLPHYMGRGLLPLKDTLRSLIMSGETELDAFGDEQELAIGSFRDFTKLQHIEMDRHILLGARNHVEDENMADSAGESENKLCDIVPRSLEVLITTTCGTDVLEQCLELLERRAELAPALQRLELTLCCSKNDVEPLMRLHGECLRSASTGEHKVEFIMPQIGQR